MRTAIPRLAVLVAAAISTLALLAVLAPIASAEYLGHTYDFTITGSGTHQLGFELENVVAVDNSGGPSDGDIYVGEGANHRVLKFDSEGHFILMFGGEVNETTGGNVCTAASGNVCKAGLPGGGAEELGHVEHISVDNSHGPSAGDIYVNEFSSKTVRKYDESGSLVTSWANGGVLTGAGSPNGPFREIEGLTTDLSGNLYVLAPQEGTPAKVVEFKPDGTPYPERFSSCREDSTHGGLGISATGKYFYKRNNYGFVQRFAKEINECGEFQGYRVQAENDNGFAVDPTNGTVYTSSALRFPGHYSILEYLVNGSDQPLDPSGKPCPAANLKGEYSSGCPYTHSFGSEQLPGTSFSAEGAGIAVNTETNTVYVTRPGQVLVYKALEVPKLKTEAPTNVEETTATLEGEVDPDNAGADTACFFEFGPTTSYGNTIPCEQSTPINTPTHVSADISKLSKGHLYHFRLAATNGSGTAYGPDRTLTTSGPPSVNSFSATELTATTARLEAVIVPNSSDTEYRFEYGTSLNYGQDVPIHDEDIGSGAEPVEVSQEVTGLTKATYHFRVVASNGRGTTDSEDQSFNFFPPTCPNRLIRQQSGSDYLPDCRAYELVSPEDAGNVIFSAEEWVPPPTYATDPPRYMFGGSLGIANGTESPNGNDLYLSTRTSKGWKTTYIGPRGNEVLEECGMEGDRTLSEFYDFVCAPTFPGVIQPEQNIPFVWDAENHSLGRWPASTPLIPNANSIKGTYQASPDFSHLAFSSEDVAFAPGGLTEAPGSAYDYNTATGSTSIVSITAKGAPIEQEPGNVGNKESIKFPGAPLDSSHPSVSTDGSHILMSTESGSGGTVRLYMRVDDAVTYEVSKERPVTYVGMTEDGKKVFFISTEQLTEDDHDESADLYMWSEATDSLTRISKGEGEAGNVDSCNASWTTKCGVKTPETEFNYSLTDSPIAQKSGDIYFYSPERLVGVDAPANERNLYVYRNGEVHYVTTGATSRMQVTPEGDVMAFITAAQVTSFNNRGFAEMYTYRPASGRLVCVSCSTEGHPPTGDTTGALEGRFITDDGRTFFYTPDALVPQDTDGIHDVYEFTEGRPQLITSGTGSQDKLDLSGREPRSVGLEAVSADGVNVYFSTYDTLISSDLNGQFIKFYDARAGGGFPTSTPLQPCAAADECHGPGTSAPVTQQASTEGDLGSGDDVQRQTKKKTPKHHKKSHHRGKGHKPKKKGQR